LTAIDIELIAAQVVAPGLLCLSSLLLQRACMHQDACIKMHPTQRNFRRKEPNANANSAYRVCIIRGIRLTQLDNHVILNHRMLPPKTMQITMAI